MSVKLAPYVSRGVTMPKFVQPLMKAGMGLSHLVFRMLGDRMKVQGQRLLMLTTVGARTGKRRQAVLARPDPTHPGTCLVIGSNGGSARHPSWCYNLAKNPEQVWIKVGRAVIKALPDSLHGAEREDAWKRVVAAAPGYSRYETTTDREIPIIRLTPDTEVA